MANHRLVVAAAALVALACGGEAIDNREGRGGLTLSAGGRSGMRQSVGVNLNLKVAVLSQNMANKPLPKTAKAALQVGPAGEATFMDRMTTADILVVAAQEVGGEMSSLLAEHKANCGGNYLTKKSDVSSWLTVGKMDQKIHVGVRTNVCGGANTISDADVSAGSVCLGLGQCNKGINWIRIRLCDTGKALLLISGHLPMDGKRKEEHNWDLGYESRNTAWQRFRAKLVEDNAWTANTIVVLTGDLNYRYDTQGEQLSRAIAAADVDGQGWNGAVELAGPTHFTCRYGKIGDHSVEGYQLCRHGEVLPYIVPPTPGNAWKRGTWKYASDKESPVALMCGSLEKWRPMSRCDRIITWVGATGATIGADPYYSTIMMMAASDHNAIVGAFTLSVPRPAAPAVAGNRLRFVSADQPTGGSGAPPSISGDGIVDSDDTDEDDASSGVGVPATAPAPPSKGSKD